MSAKELLKQVSDQLEQLPREEREAFFDGVVNLEQRLPPTRPRLQSRRLRWPDIHVRHRRIFGKAVLPENIVLAAREEAEG